jgi:sterol 3beta-glucosyltransferase
LNITILALGSRGDVQPALALGVALQRAGYRVRLGSYAQFADLAHTYGLAFTAIAGDIEAMLQSADGQAMLRSRNPARLLRLIRTYMRETAEQAKYDIMASIVDAEALVSLGIFYYTAQSLAELRGLPHVTAALQPNLPTGAFPAPLLPPPPLNRPLLNRLSHQLADQLFFGVVRPALNGLRHDLAMAPLPLRPAAARAITAGQPALYAFSRLLVPKPADWPPSAQITGFWFLDAQAAYTPPAELAAFLAAGDPPVYIGYGSMNTRDPQRSAEIALRALALSGRRGLLTRGWGGLAASDLPPDTLMINDVPHSWLFPQLSAVVHHGGAGTTAAGLRAGVPSIITPFFADQPFWAQRVATLGVGPAPIPQAQLTAERLARAITATADPAVKRRAAAVGALISAEDGVGRAVATLERTFGH